MSELAYILARLIRRGTTGADPADREAWIRRHRLEPLVYGVEIDDLLMQPEFLAECRQAYLNMTGRAVTFLRESQRLVEVLHRACIPSVAWRGVVHGEELYGDPGLRYCTDIDVIVEPAHRAAALEVLLADGYTLRNRLIPRWYLHRHHLHWPLISADGAKPVDLHWAVDHPYKNMTLPVDLGAMSRMDGKLQMAVYHAEKECRLSHAGSVSDAIDQVLREGPLLPWIDLVLMVNRATPDELAEAGRQCRERGHGELWSRSMELVRGLGEESVSTFQAAPRAGSLHAASLAGRFAYRFGCRPEVLTDWIDYVLARSCARHWTGRVADHLTRWAKLFRLGFDTVACGIWMAVRKVTFRRDWTVMA